MLIPSFVDTPQSLCSGHGLGINMGTRHDTQAAKQILSVDARSGRISWTSTEIGDSLEDAGLA